MDRFTAPSQRAFGASLLVLGLVLPFLGKPVHLDDTNFLRLAEGAARDPWRPHDIDINWLGTTQRAFDVLSNPPGLAWWLLPVRDASETVLHAWMLPWLGLALFGVARLATAFRVERDAALLVIGTAPVFVLSAQSITPDLPLLACALAGLGGFLTSQRGAWGWALLAGCAALFRYSGVCLVPLVLFAGWQMRRLPQASAVLLPTAALALHDLHAYGAVHLVSMIGFQGVSNAPEPVFRKAVAALATFGGACVLPVLVWRRSSWIPAAGGAALGCAAALLSRHDPLQLFTTVAFSAAGAASLATAIRSGWGPTLLKLWALGGFLFLLTPQFMATRYWLPFYPAVALAVLGRGVSRRRLTAGVALNVALSLGLSIDDYAFASRYREAARTLAAGRPPGAFSGHWGWQYYMIQEGWRPLEAGEDDFDRLAVAIAPWPQNPGPEAPLELLGRTVLPDRFPGPRLHSGRGAANYHNWLVSDVPIVETYAPWTFSDEPYDRILLFGRRDSGEECGAGGC